METKINLINYLPEFLREIREYKALTMTENGEINSLWKGVEEAFDNQTVDTANDYGISRLEKIMNINSTSTDINERKTEIKTRLGQKLPYTEYTLRNTLDEFCQSRISKDQEYLEGYDLQILLVEHTVKVLISLWNKNKRSLIETMIRQMCPANMLCLVDLKYNTYGSLQKLELTYEQLSKLTYRQIREDVLEDVLNITYEDLNNLSLTYEDIEGLAYDEIETAYRTFVNAVSIENS